ALAAGGAGGGPGEAPLDRAAKGDVGDGLVEGEPAAVEGGMVGRDGGAEGDVQAVRDLVVHPVAAVLRGDVPEPSRAQAADAHRARGVDDGGLDQGQEPERV